MDSYILPQPFAHRLGTGGVGTSFVQPPPGKGPPSTTIDDKTSDGIRRPLPLVSSLPPSKSKESVENDVGVDKPPPTPWVSWSTNLRPLSDIRELTEPSLGEFNFRGQDIAKKPLIPRRTSLERKGSLARDGSSGRNGSLKGSLRGRTRSGASRIAELEENQRTPQKEQADRSSAHSLLIEDVPPRSSSRTNEGKAAGHSLGPSHQPTIPLPAPRGLGYTIPDRGRSQSPVKEALKRSNQSSENMPFRTFMRTIEPNYDVLEFPKHQHPRVSVELHVSAPLFVGGGSVEGYVRITVDDFERMRHRRQLAISRVSMDLLGVEEMSGAKRNVYLNLATELIDSEKLPPDNMVESLKQISPLDPFWLLTPSVSILPFVLSLPLDVGPPPFHSKHARIRYVLCVTLLVRDQGRQYLVRCSQEISVLSVYDPEKALMSLPSPLTASDEYVRQRADGSETIKVTAGLHRQVWVSGTSIFVDVHIANSSKKTVKRLELQLERDVLCYKHTAATTLEKSASQARIFDHNERTILNKSVLKAGAFGSNGVASHSSELRTCDLELPRGHATVKCGKYFEVRYFLNVIVSVSHGKKIKVQLPIVLVHMNSLDVVPNSVAQVATAIEEKKAKTRRQNHNRQRAQSQRDPPVRAASAGRTSSPSRLARRPSSSSASVQGRAFAAPRKQSLDRIRAEVEELSELGKLLETSPRKYPHSPKRRAATSTQNQAPSQPDSFDYQTPPSERRPGMLDDDECIEVTDLRSRLRRMRSNETTRSMGSAAHHKGNDSSNLKRGNSVRSSAGRSESVGFRELEVGIGLRSASPAVMPSRFESLSAGSARQSQCRKKKSSDRWKGPSWLSDKRINRSRERSLERYFKERERDKDEKEKMMANWI